MNLENRRIGDVVLPPANYIAGEFVETPDADRIEVRNPATGGVFADIRAAARARSTAR
ncbi:hypothetical protein WJ970_35190 [Achromobacter xylosoxidans]